MSRTYGTLEYFAGLDKWVIRKVEPHVAIRLKHIFPRIAKTQTENFAFPNDQVHCADLDWFTSRYPLAITADDLQRLRGGRLLFEQTQAELESILALDYTPPAYVGLKPGQVVRPYQAQAIETLYRRGGLLLGDDLGLGKTYTAAGFMLKPGTLPAAVVMQVHLQKQWKEKIEAFTSLRVHMIKGTKPYELPPADVYLFRYSQVLGWIDTFEQSAFKTVVFDEVQELRTGAASGKGAACIQLAKHAEYRLGLSATPIYNYGSEIWAVMQAIDDKVLGPWADFLREWTDGDRIVKDAQALGTTLREQHVFLRRTKKDVGQQVPPINRLVEAVESDGKAIAAIEEYARKLAETVYTGTFEERGQAARELDLRVRHATGVGKAHQVAAYVRILLESGMPVMLMGWHRDCYDTWLEDLKDFNPVMYTGSESPKQKDESVAAFVEGRSKLFIMSLRSGAGLDGLQHVCSTVVFGELDWSPKVHEQVIGRLDREGQTEQVTAIYLNSDDGSDPPMVALLGLKASQSDAIVDPGREFEAVSRDASRVKALARQFLDRKRVKELEALSPEAAADSQQPADEPVQLALVA